jgi:fumarate hydratase class I
MPYHQVAPLDMYKEVNTATNLPAQIDIFATAGDQYKFLFMAKVPYHSLSCSFSMPQ